MRYEISNPHDQAYIEAPSDPTAVAAVALLGEGRYSAKREGFDGPFFLFSGHDEWFRSHSARDGLEDYVISHMAEIGEALLTVRLARKQTSVTRFVESANAIGRSLVEKAKEQ